MSDRKQKVLGIYGDGEQANRFRTLKHESKERLGRDELTHVEFLKILLDVWEDNLEMSRDEFPDCPECESNVFVGKNPSGNGGFHCYLCDIVFSG